MIRKAFSMSVYPHQIEEYTRRHNPIWSDLASTLREHGVHNYSIFHHPETNQLFGYAEVESEAQWEAISQTEVCQKWWQHMSPIMPSDANHRPISQSLEEVFHLD